jgi:dihydrofolate reductase
VIGLDGGMPWRLSTDLRRFKTLTMGGTLIMGRKTFDSIGKPLPGRETIVLSRSIPSAEPVASLHWAQTIDQVLQTAKSLAKPVYVVGGAEIYRLFFDYCDEILLTRVHLDVAGDTRIDLPLEDFELVDSVSFPKTDRDCTETEFQRWNRKKIRAKNSIVPIE